MTAASRDFGALEAAQTGVELTITATLEWLWDNISERVLRTLGHTDIPHGRWPRVWWCPTGPLTLLPVHAAGAHDWQAAGRLVTVVDLAHVRGGGEFVFLSACKSATGGITNLDEAINVAAALSYGGWRHVIGTLWSVWDHVAAAVTTAVYPRLIDSQGRLEPGETARVLHAAICEIRGADPSQPSIWAPFIHIGG